MKSLSFFLAMVLALGLVFPVHAWYKTVGRLEVYLHHEAFPDCKFPLTKANRDLELFLSKGQDTGRLIPDVLPARIPLNINCGDCRMTGELQVWLVEGTLRKVKGKKMLDFAFTWMPRRPGWNAR